MQEPPLITRPTRAHAELLAAGLDDYLRTLPSHWARILGGYTLVDFAHKVVGVGSVGLRAYVALLEGSSPDDVLFLQLKQARRSVLGPYVHGDRAWHAHQGQRVVEYQQALQTVSDPLLGWTTVGEPPVLRAPVPGHEGRDHRRRHRRGRAGRLRRCLRLAAGQGHARTSGASMIAGYVGRGGHAGRRAVPVRPGYADQTEADHARCSSPSTRGAAADPDH